MLHCSRSHQQSTSKQKSSRNTMRKEIPSMSFGDGCQMMPKGEARKEVLRDGLTRPNKPHNLKLTLQGGLIDRKSFPFVWHRFFMAAPLRPLKAVTCVTTVLRIPGACVWGARETIVDRRSLPTTSLIIQQAKHFPVVSFVTVPRLLIFLLSFAFALPLLTFQDV
jgi:hypothetical protein